MKKILIFALFLMSLTAYATPAPVECFNSARLEEYLDAGQAIQLCSAAPTAEGPIECYREARLESLLTGWAIRLCTGASSNAPVECFREARLQAMPTDQAIYLCAARGVTPR